MDIAKVMSSRSTCLRLKVGSVIAKEGRIISTGYNGAPSGVPHCDHTNCGPDRACTRTVHAEAGAISFAARFGVPLEGSSLYVTNSPCLDCSKLIINAGIKEVFFHIPYRITDGLQLLQSVGIHMEQL